MVHVNYLLVNEKYNFNIWNKKYYLEFDITNCIMFLLNSPQKIIISSLPFKFSLEVKI